MVRLAIAIVSLALAGGHVIAAHGVRLTVPEGWSRITSAGDGPVTDPRTLLVVGTATARPRPSRSQVAAYRIPPRGAVVVVLGWTGANGDRSTGRAPLSLLTTVRRSVFECFAGRGAAATLVIHGREYQVNVMVGAEASRGAVARALAVARSFDALR